MPFMKPTNLEPENTVCITFQVPDDVIWLANFRGALEVLAKWYNHHRDSERTGKAIAARWREVIDNEMACGMLEDIRINDDRLEKKFIGNPAWIDVGAINVDLLPITDAEITMLAPGSDATANIEGTVLQLGIPMAYDGTDGDDGTDGINGADAVPCDCSLEESQYGLPEVMDEDRMCRASWILARALCDDFSDAGLLFALGQRLIVTSIQAFLASIPGVNIVAMLTEQQVEWLTEDLPQIIMDYIRSQARDPETIAWVAEQLYCSIQDNYPNNLDEVLDDIPMGIYAPLFADDPLTGALEWTNFKELAESIYETLTGHLVGYLILGYAMQARKYLLDRVGIVTPIQKAIAFAINTAETFDSRDCSGFGCYEGGWCRHFDFAEGKQGWELLVAVGEEYGIEGEGFFASKLDIFEDANPALGINVPSAIQGQVVRVKVWYSTAYSTWGVTFNEELIESPLPPGSNMVSELEFEVPLPVIGESGLPQFTQSTIMFGSNEEGAYITVSAVEIEGLGTIPYSEGANCEVEE